MDITILLVLVLALGAGVALVEAAIRRSDVGAALVLLIMVVDEAAFIQNELVVGPVRFVSRDVIIGVLLVASIARALRSDRITNPQRLLIGFGAVIAISLMRGVDAYGVPATFNEGRKFLLFVVVAFYFSTVEFRPELTDRLARLWLAASVALCGLAVLRWGANAAGVTGGLFGDGGSLRVISTSKTLTLAQGGVMAIPLLADRGRGLLRYLAPMLLVVVLLLQHRTVWLVTLAATTYLLVRRRTLGRQALTALSIGALIFGVLMFAVFDQNDDAIGDQLADSASSTVTFEWRVGGWLALIEQNGPEEPGDVAVGLPFGGGWDRTYEGRFVDVSPHSFYLEPYLRVGLIGLGLLLATYVVAIRGTRRRTADDPGTLLPPDVLHVLIAAQLIYYVTYTPDASQGVLLGLGCAAAGATSSAATWSRERIPELRG